LNGFQRVILLWEEIHPYNAACVLKLEGLLDGKILQDAIQTTCRMAGLGRLVIDAKKAVLHYEPLDAVTLKIIKPRDEVADSLDEILTEEINEPFPQAPHHPIRWILLDAAKTCFLVVVWRHIVADAASVHLLLAQILTRYYERSENQRGGLSLEPAGLFDMTRSQHRQFGYLNTLFRAVRLYSCLRRVYRLEESKDGAESTRVLFLSSPPGLLDRLRTACRIRRVTVHDAFLAALIAALAEITPSRQSHRKRRGLAVATAVDLRRIDREQLSERFGLYVGHWINVVDEPEALDLERMLQEIGRQTQREKTEQTYAGPEWHWWAVLFVRRWLSVNQNRAWYRKVYPLSAGVSHVRLNASGFGAAKEKVLRYFLVPPPGPALPLFVGPASLDDDLTFTVVYREAALDGSQVERLMAAFFARLELFTRRGPAGDD
jgi:hypothetical protein